MNISWLCISFAGQEIKEEEDEVDADKRPVSGFIASKWETVDPEQIEAQAMTTSKWDMLENSQDASRGTSSNEKEEDDSIDYSDPRWDNFH